MATGTVEFSLSYLGRLADDQAIDLYDVAEALTGFQRSLALTTHLVLNNEVITQAPSLKGAQILAFIPEQGTWKIKVAVIVGIATGVYKLGTAPKDTPLGNLISSAYDYVISETLGFHVDYSKTLGKQYEELRRSRTDIKPLEQPRFDAVVEKCEAAIKAMHRPITMSESADEAKVTATIEGPPRPIGETLNRETFEYLAFTERDDHPREIVGRVSSYNINTFKGRIYIPAEGRPIPFTLAESARSRGNIALITGSLRLNAADRREPGGEIRCIVLRNMSRSGRLKSLIILEVSK
jgi:hypothetical protein